MSEKIVKFLVYPKKPWQPHVLFWLLYYVYRIYLYSHHDTSVYVQFLELPVKIATVYLNLYLLLPYLLYKRRPFTYATSLSLVFVLATLLQIIVIKYLIIPLDMIKGSYTAFSYKWGFLSISSHIIEIVLVTMMIHFFKSYYITYEQNEQLKQEKLHTELLYLRNQLHPHFLFNTLNNLYALVLSRSETAEKVILQLSDLLSHMIYRSSDLEVSLEEETAFLKNYTDLEKLRFGDELEVIWEEKGNFSGLKIAPLLLLTFIENSFKHSHILPNRKNTIYILLELQDKRLHYKVSNNFKEKIHERAFAGLGLQNLRRRLELSSPSYYELHFEKEENKFEAQLILQLE